MNPRNKMIPGLRRPTDQEKKLVTEQWRNGVGLGYLRFMRACGLVLMVFCALLTLACLSKGAEGIVAALTMGICTGFFGVLFLLMNGRVKRTKRYLTNLEQGAFLLTQAICTQCFVFRGNRHHVGHATVELADGRKLNDLRMPYQTVKNMKWEGRFPVLIVQMENESILLAFAVQ